MTVLMGVDVGSSGAKATAIDAHGSVLVASATHPYTTQYPQPGWAEQDPRHWSDAASAAIHQCVASGAFAPGAVEGLAIVGPAHNVALLDEHGAILRPTIHWSDLRSAPQCAQLQAQAGSRIFTVTGQPVNPSWTLAQLLWLRQNEPQTWMRLRRVLVTKDYVRCTFTGCYATDRFDAIGLQLFDLALDRWSEEMCGLIDFPLEWLPPVESAFTVAGGLLSEAAAATGLPTGTPVAVGSADVTVEAFGVGAVEPGAAIVKLGTAGCVNLVTAAPHPSAQTLTYRHVAGDYGFTIAATNSGTGALTWFRKTFCSPTMSFGEISVLAAQAPPGADGLIFHPYLSGERTPYWDPQLRGDFVGIGAHHELRHFARAVMEGVAFSLADCLTSVQALGEPVDDIRIVGGGAKSDLWRQIVADVLGRPLIKPAVEDAAFGAALLAGVAVGVFANWRTALAQCGSHETVIQPDAARHELYHSYFAIYRSVTHDLVIHSHRLAALAGR
jgi:xylulokinase